MTLITNSIETPVTLQSEVNRVTTGAINDVKSFRATVFQQRIREALVTKYGVSPFEILQWVQEMMEYVEGAEASEIGRLMKTDKGIHPCVIYSDYMRKFKKTKKDHGKLWERGATQGVWEQTTTDFQNPYIMRNVFPGQKAGPEGERDRLRTCLYYPVKSSTYR